MRTTLRRLFIAGAAAAAALAVPGSAHHSTAMFEWGTSVEMKNVTVERWVWTNPHTFLYVRDAAGNRWAFEGMSPNHLSRAGWCHVAYVGGELALLLAFALTSTPPATVLLVSLILTAHVPLGLLQPAWFARRRVFWWSINTMVVALAMVWLVAAWKLGASAK